LVVSVRAPLGVVPAAVPAASAMMAFVMVMPIGVMGAVMTISEPDRQVVRRRCRYAQRQRERHGEGGREPADSPRDRVERHRLSPFNVSMNDTASLAETGVSVRTPAGHIELIGMTVIRIISRFACAPRRQRSRVLTDRKRELTIATCCANPGRSRRPKLRSG